MGSRFQVIAGHEELMIKFKVQEPYRNPSDMMLFMPAIKEMTCRPLHIVCQHSMSHSMSHISTQHACDDV